MDKLLTPLHKQHMQANIFGASRRPGRLFGVFLALAICFLAQPLSNASVIAYWNMDALTLAGKLPANAGTQGATVTASFDEFAVGFLSGIDPVAEGTTINIVGSEGWPNRGVGFFRIGAIYENGAFVMSGFDFTGLSTVAVSFAYKSEFAFTWDEDLNVDYRINSGSWVDIEELQTWSPNFSLASISFGNLLDDTANVDLRIRTTNWLSTFGYLDIDNVKITAVPEPSSAVLLFAALVFAVLKHWPPNCFHGSARPEAKRCRNAGMAKDKYATAG